MTVFYEVIFSSLNISQWGARQRPIFAFSELNKFDLEVVQILGKSAQRAGHFAHNSLFWTPRSQTHEEQAPGDTTLGAVYLPMGSILAPLPHVTGL